MQLFENKIKIANKYCTFWSILSTYQCLYRFCFINFVVLIYELLTDVRINFTSITRKTVVCIVSDIIDNYVHYKYYSY